LKYTIRATDATGDTTYLSALTNPFKTEINIYQRIRQQQQQKFTTQAVHPVQKLVTPSNKQYIYL